MALMHRTFWAMCILTALVSCAGRRPPLPSDSIVRPPSTWRDGEQSATKPVDTRWWHEFGDSRLDAVVERAIRENDDERIAIIRVNEAKGAVRLARAALLPSVDVEGLARRHAGVSPFGRADMETAKEFDVSIAYNTDIFGRIRHEVASAAASLSETEAIRDAVQLSVASATAAAYITLTALDARLQVAESTLTLRTESLRVAQHRLSAGYSGALDLRQAQSELLATQQLIPALHLAIAAQENALSVLLGQAPGPIVRGATLDEVRIPEMPRTLPAILVRQRPDIYAAEQHLVAADQALSAARSAFLPSISLEAGAARAFSTLYPQPVSLWSVGGSILAPLFEGGALHARQDIAAARRDEAAFAYRGTVLNAFREVEDQMTTISETGEQVKMISAQADVLADAYHLATRRYRTGYSSYLEQLDAQRGLLNAQLALVQMQASYLLACVNLFRAVGGGWHAPGTDLHIRADPSK